LNPLEIKPNRVRPKDYNEEDEPKILRIKTHTMIIKLTKDSMIRNLIWMRSYDNRKISYDINNSFKTIQNSFKKFYSSINYYSYWDRLLNGIDSVISKNCYPGNIYASTSFIEPYPRINEFEILILAFIQLLEQYAYNIDSKYVKFTMGYKMCLPTVSEVSFILGKAIPLCDLNGNRLPKKKIYDKIEELVRLYGEKYEDAVIKGIFINIYYESNESIKSLDFPNIPASDMVERIINVMDTNIISCCNLPEVKSLRYKQSRIPSKISALKGNNQLESRPFIVADIETILVNNVHVPYAIGYLVVMPGDDLTSKRIETLFSENYITFYLDFAERSKKMLFHKIGKMCDEK